MFGEHKWSMRREEVKHLTKVKVRSQEQWTPARSLQGKGRWESWGEHSVSEAQYWQTHGCPLRSRQRHPNLIKSLLWCKSHLTNKTFRKASGASVMIRDLQVKNNNEISSLMFQLDKIEIPDITKYWQDCDVGRTQDWWEWKLAQPLARTAWQKLVDLLACQLCTWQLYVSVHLLGKFLHS